MCIKAHNWNQLNTTLKTAVFGKSIYSRKKKWLEDLGTEVTKDNYIPNINNYCALSVEKGAIINL